MPTAHYESIKNIAGKVDAIYCPNIHRDWSFAVADAYEYWSDIGEKEAKEIFNSRVGDINEHKTI